MGRIIAILAPLWEHAALSEKTQFSGGLMNEPANEVLNSWSNGPASGQPGKPFRQALALQRLATIRMRRPALGFIPGRVALIASGSPDYRFSCILPSPQGLGIAVGPTSRPRIAAMRPCIPRPFSNPAYGSV